MRTCSILASAALLFGVSAIPLGHHPDLREADLAPLIEPGLPPSSGFGMQATG